MFLCLECEQGFSFPKRGFILLSLARLLYAPLTFFSSLRVFCTVHFVSARLRRPSYSFRRLVWITCGLRAFNLAVQGAAVIGEKREFSVLPGYKFQFVFARECT